MVAPLDKRLRHHLEEERLLMVLAKRRVFVIELKCERVFDCKGLGVDGWWKPMLQRMHDFLVRQSSYLFIAFTRQLNTEH